jgi:hypothetical protein
MQKRPGFVIWITVTTAMVLFAVIAGTVIFAMQERTTRQPAQLLALPTIVASPDLSLLTVIPPTPASQPAAEPVSTPTAASQPPLATPVPEIAAAAAPAPTVVLVPILTETPLSPEAPALAPAPPQNQIIAPQPTAVLVLATAIPVPACGAASVEVFGLIDADGSYKGNALTDHNPDFRLGTLGYVDVSAPLNPVEYQGPADTDHPLRFSAIFNPGRMPAFVRTYQRRDWIWNEGGPPPYGEPGGPNTEWPVTVLELETAAGEGIYPAARNRTIGGGFVAMVLYADEYELTLAYFRQDSVGNGYVLYLSGFCVDPGLVALYRAQLADGRRATGKLPGVRNGQRVGSALGASVRVAVGGGGGGVGTGVGRCAWRCATAGRFSTRVRAVIGGNNTPKRRICALIWIRSNYQHGSKQTRMDKVG